MKKTVGLLLVLLITIQTGFSQISHYSQFYSTPMTLAPSFTGLIEGSRLSLNYRDQWPAVPGVFRTYSVGIDHNYSRAKSGIGLLVFRDVAGEGNLGLTEASLLYSYKIQIGQKRGNINSDGFYARGFNSNTHKDQ